MFLTELIRFLTSLRVAIGASSHGSGIQPASEPWMASGGAGDSPRPEPGKDGGSVAHLKSARATDDAGWRRFAAGWVVLAWGESPISCGDLLPLRLLLGGLLAFSLVLVLGFVVLGRLVLVLALLAGAHPV
jgi:hypothetical protein